jgi:hypothetical protein
MNFSSMEQMRGPSLAAFALPDALARQVGLITRVSGLVELSSANNQREATACERGNSATAQRGGDSY